MVPHSQMHAVASQCHAGARHGVQVAQLQHLQVVSSGTHPWQAHGRPQSVDAPAWGTHATQAHMHQHVPAHGYFASQQQPRTFMGQSQPGQRVPTGTQELWTQDAAPLGLQSSNRSSYSLHSSLASQAPLARPHSAAGSCVQTSLAGPSANTSFSSPHPRSQSAPAQQRPSDRLCKQEPLHATVCQMSRPGSAGGTQVLSHAAATQGKNEPAKSAGRGLTEEQQEVVDRVLDWNDYVLVMGLPGAGKTTTIAAVVQVPPVPVLTLATCSGCLEQACSVVPSCLQKHAL